MTLAHAITIALQGSMAVTVFCLALNTSPRDVSELFRRPGLLVRSLFAMNVVMPLLAAAFAIWFDLRHALKVALVTLALSPVPPILPKKQIRGGGTASFSVGLLAIAALTSVFFVPVAIELLGRFTGRPMQVSSRAIAAIVTSSVLALLALGFLLRSLAPLFAARLARLLSLLAAVVLVTAMLPILITAWSSMGALIGNLTLVAIAAFVLAGLGVGHVLGGPDPADRTVLALATATRHPGVAIAIAHAAAPGAEAAPAAVLLYLIVGAIVSIPYVARRKRGRVAPPTPAR